MEMVFSRTRRRAATSAAIAVATVAGHLLGTAGAGAAPLNSTDEPPAAVMDHSTTEHVDDSVPGNAPSSVESEPGSVETPAQAVSEPPAAAASAPALTANAQRPFADVASAHKFAREINWMYETGLSTGTQTPAGRLYKPSENLTREAMAAFMFRKYAPSNYQAPARSWFNDVKPEAKFYREISWMYEYGLSTGTNNEYDGRIYQPKQQLTREAMAAFMYRALYQGGYYGRATHLIDVSYSAPFSDEISWMFHEGLSTGTKTPAGIAFQPKGKLSREAMAAFMYRSKAMPAEIRRIPNPTPPPSPKPRPKPPTTKPPVAGPPFKNCTEAWNAGQAPLTSSHPRWANKLDRDGDGVACEKDPR